MESPYFQVCTIADWKILKEISSITFESAFAAQNTAANMQYYMERAFSETQIKKELSNPNSFFYLVYSGDLLIGYFKLNVGIAQNEPIEDGLEIERIYLLPAYQGFGFGQLMMNEIISIARKLKIFKLWLGVWDQNFGAIKFYQRNGFSKFATHEFRLGTDLQMDNLMEITLEND